MNRAEYATLWFLRMKRRSFSGTVKVSRKREPIWTESIAVGSEGFVRQTKAGLGIKAIGREVIGEKGVCELREPEIPYSPNIGDENDDLRHQNTYFWDISD